MRKSFLLAIVGLMVAAAALLAASAQAQAAPFVYVANQNDGKVSQYDTDSRGRFPISPPTGPAGRYPGGVAMSPDGKSVYVTTAGRRRRPPCWRPAKRSRSPRHPRRGARNFHPSIRARPHRGEPALFGPGPHWVDEVTSGTVTFGAEASVDLDLDFDGAADLVVAVAGTTTVFRSSARERDPVGDPGHRNRLQLEIVSARLAATESPVGPVTLTFGDGVGNLIADGPLYSAGVSDEIPGCPELARDVFEIFFEVEASGLRLHNESPLVMTAVIDRLPPIGSPFMSAGSPIPLVTDAGAPVLQVVEARFTAVPISPYPWRSDARGCAGHRGSSQNRRNSAGPRNTVSAPSTRPTTAENHSTSGWADANQASTSPRFQPSATLRTASTFSCDIAYSDSPTAARASERSQ